MGMYSLIFLPWAIQRPYGGAAFRCDSKCPVTPEHDLRSNEVGSGSVEDL